LKYEDNTVSEPGLQLMTPILHVGISVTGEIMRGNFELWSPEKSELMVVKHVLDILQNKFA